MCYSFKDWFVSISSSIKHFRQLSDVGFGFTPGFLDCDLNAAPWTARPSLQFLTLMCKMLFMFMLYKSHFYMIVGLTPHIHNKMTSIIWITIKIVTHFLNCYFCDFFKLKALNDNCSPIDSHGINSSISISALSFELNLNHLPMNVLIVTVRE